VTDFVDRFSEELKNNGESIKREIDTDLDIELLEQMEVKFKAIYTRKDVKEKQDDFRVVATDAGRNDIELKNNSRIYILQGAAVDNKGGVNKDIDVGSLKIFKQQDYEKFMQRGSEVVEIKSILKAIENIEEEKLYILIDGTLLTRLLATPEIFDLSRNRFKSIELMNKFQKLVEKTVSNENIVLAGVSKDSNSSLLYRKLIGDMIEKRVDNLNLSKLDEVSEEDKEYLKNNYHRIRYRPQDVRRNLENLEAAGAEKEKISDIRDLVEQYRTRFSDTEIIEEMTNEKGFTKPLRLGRIKPEFFSTVEDFQDKGIEFIQNEFTNEEKNPEMDSKKISKVLNRVANSPGVISSYWKPSENDTPLRIDLLNHDVDGKKLMDCSEQEFVDCEPKLRDILELLKTGYAGEGMHNVWISQADNSASLKNRDIENIYKPVLEKNLGINLRNYMRRRDKRV